MEEKEVVGSGRMCAGSGRAGVSGRELGPGLGSGLGGLVGRGGTSMYPCLQGEVNEEDEKVSLLIVMIRTYLIRPFFNSTPLSYHTTRQSSHLPSFIHCY